MACLIYIKEDSERMVFPLGRAMLMIGSDPHSGLQLNDNSVSKDHASIIFEKGEYVLHDNGSVSGSYVNGEKASVRAIKHNDLVRFGQYSFLVDLVSDGSESSKLPAQESSNLERKGHSFQRAFNLFPSKKEGSAGGPLKIIMADHPKKKQTSAPAKSESTVKFSRFALPAFAILATIFAIYFAIKASDLEDKWNEFESKQKAEGDLKQEDESQTKELQSRLLTSESRAKDLERILAQTRSEFESYQKKTDSAKVSKLNTSLKQVEADFADYKAKHPEHPVPTLPAAIVIESPKFDAISTDPVLPNEVMLIQDADVIVKTSAGFPKNTPFSKNTKFNLVDASEDDLTIELPNHDLGQIAKSKTNFQSLYEALAREQKEKAESTRKEKEALFQQKVRIAATVNQILPQGFTSDRKPDTGEAAYVYVSGLSTSKLVNGQAWVGDAFPMGTIVVGGNKLQRRQFTASFDEFYDYQESLKKASNPTLKPQVKFGDLITLMQSLDLDEMIKKTDLPPNEAHNTFNYTEATRYITKLGSKWQQASEQAAQLLKNDVDPDYKRFLRKLIGAATMAQHPEDIGSFHRMIIELNTQWGIIKRTSSGG
jgi:predicted component of type VI protein secretion system